MYETKVNFFTFLLLLCTLCFNVNLADVTAGTCVLLNGKDPITSPFPLDDIQDVYEAGTNLFKNKKISAGADVKGITKVEATPNNLGKSKYVSETVDQTTKEEFKLLLGADFKDYEKNEILTEMTIAVTLDCGADLFKRVVFKLKIIDTNNNNPEFEEKLYEYELPIPFPKDMILEPFGKSGLKNIVAKDIDLTNKEVTFTLVKNDANSTDDELFSIEWDKKQTGKLYTAVLKSKTDLKFDREISLTVMAKDSGEPANTSNATIKISPRIANKINFDSVIYFANCEQCKSSDKSVDISFKPEIKLSMSNDTDSPKISVQTESKDLKDSFSATIDKNSTVHMSLLKLPQDFKDDYIFLTLIASKGGFETKAYAHIALPQSQTVVQEASNGGLIAATVILSLLLVGLIIAAAYYYNKLR